MHALPARAGSRLTAAAGTVYMCQHSGRGRRSRPTIARSSRHSRCAVVGRHAHRGSGHRCSGFAFDAGSGDKELTSVFAALLRRRLRGRGARGAPVRHLHRGHPAAADSVRRRCPAAYFLFHGAEIAGIKDLLINCGYPLIERFPLMFFTSVVVLLIGMARWYFGAANRAGKATPKDAGTAVGAGLVAGLGAKVAALLNRRAADDAEAEDAEPVRRPRKHTIDRPATAARPARRAPHHQPRRRRAGPGTPGRRRTTPTDRRPPRAGATPPARATSTTFPGLRRPVGGARHANRASSRRNASTGRVSGSRRNHRSAPDGRAAMRTPTSPKRRMARTSRRSRRRRRARIIRSRTCATAAVQTTKTAAATGGLRAADQRRAGRISRGSANTSVSLAVVTGCTMS